MTTFVVGTGIAQAMTADGTTPASDEVYSTGNGPDVQWSQAMGGNGTQYRWLKATNTVHRYPSGPAGASQLRTRFGIPPADLVAAVCSAFPPDQWVNAAEVAYYESGWRPRALLDTVSVYGACGTSYRLPDGQRATTEYSRGYFQINGCVYKEWNTDALFDPLTNAQAAAQLYRRRGNWGDWWLSAGKLGLPRA
jgi:hypothetical protein